MGYRMTARCDKMHRGDVIIKTVFCSKAERRNIHGTLREALNKSRLTAWHAICLHLFRHLARKLLAGRQPSGVVFIQSDEKSDWSSLLDRKHPCAPDLISASLAAHRCGTIPV